MNMVSPHALYKRQQGTVDLSGESAHKLIELTLQHLHRSLAVLAEGPEPEREAFRDNAARSLTAVYVLQSSLDFDRGGAIATNLFQLYEYVRQQVMKAMRLDETANLVSARDAMAEILDAWRRIG